MRLDGGTRRCGAQLAAAARSSRPQQPLPARPRPSTSRHRPAPSPPTQAALQPTQEGRQHVVAAQQVGEVGVVGAAVDQQLACSTAREREMGRPFSAGPVVRERSPCCLRLGRRAASDPPRPPLPCCSQPTTHPADAARSPLPCFSQTSATLVLRLPTPCARPVAGSTRRTQRAACASCGCGWRAAVGGGIGLTAQPAVAASFPRREPGATRQPPAASGHPAGACGDAPGSGPRAPAAPPWPPRPRRTCGGGGGLAAAVGGRPAPSSAAARAHVPCWQPATPTPSQPQPPCERAGRAHSSRASRGGNSGPSTGSTPSKMSHAPPQSPAA